MKTFILQVLTVRSYSFEVTAEDEDAALDTIYQLDSLADLDDMTEPDWIDLDSVQVLSEQDDDNE